jgi:dihydroflavonol-4-reductase
VSASGAGTTLVTGGSGFLGRHLVRRLAAEGRPLRVLERRPTDAFDGLDVERVPGDVTDPASVRRAVADVGTVFNLAGVVSHLEADRPLLRAVNGDGARTVMAAARGAGVRRVVHVSSVATVGYVCDPRDRQDEESPLDEGALRYPYAWSKRLGEVAALEAAAAGLDVVVACPALVFGPGDVNRVSTFMVEQYLRGTLRFTIPGGLTIVDARDVVDGLLLCERLGSSGRRYILGTEDGSLSHRALLRLIGEVSGRPRRTLHLPAPVLVPSARLLTPLRVPLPVRPDELDSGRHHWYSTSRRAIAELGYAPRPVREAVDATIHFLRQRGLRAR